MWLPIDLHWYFPGSASPSVCPVCLLRCWLRSLCWVFPYGARYCCYIGALQQAGPPAARSLRSYPLLTAEYEPDITLGGVLKAKL